MRIVTFIQLGFKLLSLPFLFIFIKKSSDIWLFALIANCTNFCGAIVAFYIILWVQKIRIKWISLIELKPWMKDALPFFWTVAAGTIKGQSIAIITGIYFNMSDVAVYDLAYKIISIPSTLVTSINGALFPKLILKLDSIKIKRVIRYESIIGLIAIACITIFGKWIVQFLGGNKMLFAYPMASVLSITIYSWLIVGAYINFVFVPQKLFYYITKNQLVALVSFFIYFVIGVMFFNNVILLVIALSLSSLTEVFYCKYVIKKKSLL
jgi:PST family polysaccharide transporter